MYSSEERLIKKKRKKRYGIGKAGDELSLSAKRNPNARKYIDNMDTRLPEKFSSKRYQDSEEDPHKMETVKPTRSSSKEKSPSLFEEMSFDTGWMQIGYDEKKKNTIVSVKSNYKTEKSKSVAENSSHKTDVHDGEEVISNNTSKDYETGAMALRVKDSKDYKRIRRQWQDASKQKNNDTTYDEVLPFQQIDEQKDKIKQLREMQKNSTTDRTAISTAITGAQTYLNKKQEMDLKFNQKFERAIDQVKIKFRGSDDYLLFIRKRQLADEKLLEEDIIKDEEENEEIEDENNEENDNKLDQEKQADKT